MFRLLNIIIISLVLASLQPLLFYIIPAFSSTLFIWEAHRSIIFKKRGREVRSRQHSSIQLTTGLDLDASYSYYGLEDQVKIN